MNGHTLCVDFGGTRIKLARLAGGVVLESGSLPNTNDPADLVGVAATLGTWVRAHGTPRGVGVAVPGVVTPDGAGLASAHEKYGHLLGADLRGWAAASTGVPARACVVENDARAALAGEAGAGAARGERDVVLMVLGTGIGAAALVDGRLVRGAHGFGSILGGHTTVDLAGPVCPCGNVGCAETLAGSWALGPRAAGHPGFAASPLARVPHPGVRDVLVAADAGDPCAEWVLGRAVAAWGATAVTLCHCFDPAVLVLSGAPMLASDRLLPALRDWVETHLWSGMPRPRILVAQQPELSVLRGLDHLVPTDPGSDHAPA